MNLKPHYKEIYSLYLLGSSGKEIAAKFGLNHSNSIRQILKKKGLIRTQSEASSLAVKNGKKSHAIANLIKAAKTNNRFNPAKSHHGESHPCWIKDRTKVKGKRSFTEERWFFAELIKKRYYKCEITGLNGRLSVHHIKGVWSNPELRYCEDNCIVILHSIHKKFHHIYGNRSTAEDWGEFIFNKEYDDCVKTERKRLYVPFEDKTGKRFGRLVVLYKNGKKWRCKCDCGNETDVFSGGLKGGKTQSCGCLMREVNRDKMKRLKTWELSSASRKGTITNRKTTSYASV